LDQRSKGDRNPPGPVERIGGVHRYAYRWTLPIRVGLNGERLFYMWTFISAVTYCYCHLLCYHHLFVMLTKTRYTVPFPLPFYYMSCLCLCAPSELVTLQPSAYSIVALSSSRRNPAFYTDATQGGTQGTWSGGRCRSGTARRPGASGYLLWWNPRPAAGTCVRGLRRGRRLPPLRLVCSRASGGPGSSSSAGALTRGSRWCTTRSAARRAA
jgi:hypothetical protein